MNLPLRFLFSDGNPIPARKLLVVQSGSTDLLARVVDRLRAEHPQAALTVLLRRAADDLPGPLKARTDVQYLENLGPKARLISALRRPGFDCAYVLYSNEPGYWKLKLLPLVLGVPTVIGINEHLGSFPIDLRDANRLASHLLWRLGSRPAHASVRFVEDLAHGAALPAKLAYLLAYERVASLRAKNREPFTPWKHAAARWTKRREDHD